MSDPIASKDFEILLGPEKSKWRFFFCPKTLRITLRKIENSGSGNDCGVKFEGFLREYDTETWPLGVVTTNFVANTQKDVHWNINKYITREVIFDTRNKFLVNSTLTIVIKATFSRDIKKLDFANDQPDKDLISSEVANCFNTKLYSDFKFICSNDMVIPAHRLICSAYSPVLKAMFNSDMIEAKECAVKLDDIDYETMNEILRFIYKNEVDNIEELVPKLLYGAEKYGIDELKEFCAESMIENVDVDNVLEYFVLADQYNSKDLLNYFALFIKLNYQIVRKKNKQWDTLNERYMITLLDFFNDPIVKNFGVIESAAKPN